MKNILKYGILIIGIFLSLNMAYAESFAETATFEAPTIPKPSTLPGPAENDPISNENYLTSELIPRIVRGALGILGVGSLFFVIFGGVQYLITFEDESHAESAKKTIQYALYGLIIAMLSYSIVNIISYVDGLDATQDTQVTPLKSCSNGFIYEASSDSCVKEY